MTSIRIRTWARPAVTVAGLAVAGTLLAACGSSGGGAGGSTPVAAAASALSSSGANSASAYRTCLEQHGVTLPSRSAFPRPTGSRSPGSGGGFGGGGFGGGFSTSPQMQAAMQACSSLRPTGGAGFGGGRGGTALTAFRNCMTQQGVVIPTTRPTATPTATASGSRYLGGLDPNDPKVAAALKVCQALLPTRGANPSATPTG
jgi:hypothetical protein